MGETAKRDRGGGKLSLVGIVEQAREEIGKLKTISDASKENYERRWRQLTTRGFDIANAGKSEQSQMKSAGRFHFRSELQKLARQADKIGRDPSISRSKKESEWMSIVQEMSRLLENLESFEAWDWYSRSETYDPKTKQQASHKKRAATDEQLILFYDKAATSDLLPAFLTMEFTGCRGEELAQGIRIEYLGKGKKHAEPCLSFIVESAKCDGMSKGIPLRGVSIPFPAKAPQSVRDRWLVLAQTVAAHAQKSAGKPCVIKVDPTPKQSVGVRLTQVIAKVAKKAGLKNFSAYSLRHRIASQAKSMRGASAENTAAALGHQSLRTQTRYGRKQKGKSVAPVEVIAESLDLEIRYRSPSPHSKERQAKVFALGHGEGKRALPSPAPQKAKPRGPRL